jgi:hypothetical protein
MLFVTRISGPRWRRIFTISKAVFLLGQARRKEKQKADKIEKLSHSMTPTQSYRLEHEMMSR